MRQFMLWKEFDEVEPIGGIRGDWQAASICAAFFNTMAMFSHSKQRMTVEQFLLKYGQPVVIARGKEGKSKTPSAAPQPWRHMKFIAQMQVALSKAEEAAKKKSKRG